MFGIEYLEKLSLFLEQYFEKNWFKEIILNAKHDLEDEKGIEEEHLLNLCASEFRNLQSDIYKHLNAAVLSGEYFINVSLAREFLEKIEHSLREEYKDTIREVVEEG